MHCRTEYISRPRAETKIDVKTHNDLPAPHHAHRRHRALFSLPRRDGPYLPPLLRRCLARWSLETLVPRRVSLTRTQSLLKIPTVRNCPKTAQLGPVAVCCVTRRFPRSSCKLTAPMLPIYVLQRTSRSPTNMLARSYSSAKCVAGLLLLWRSIILVYFIPACKESREPSRE